jgi:TolC family type I secretion outer membrane protein
MSRLRHGLAVLLALPLLAAGPPPDAGQGLADLLARALADSPAIGGAEATRDAAERSRIDALFGFAPRANWLFDNSRERLNVKRSNSAIYQIGISNFGNYGNTLQIVQPLFDPRLFAQLHGAQEALQRTRAELDATRQKTVFELIQAYLITLGSADALAVARAEEASLAKQHDQMDLRVKRGLSAQSDLDEVTSRLMQARAQLKQAASSLNEAFATLEHRVSGHVEAVLPLGSRIAMPPPNPATADAWVEAAKAKNPEILALDNAASEAFATFEAQGAAVLPRVDLTFTQNRAETGGSVYGGGSTITDRTVLFRLTVPLFNGDGAGYPVFAAHARYRAARYRTLDQKQEVEERVRIAFEETVGNALREHDIAQGVAAQGRVLDAKRQRFAAGVLRITEVLDSERDFYQAQRMLLASRYNYLLNLMQLKRLAGDISAADAAFIDADLQRDGAKVVRASAMGDGK